MYNPESYPNGKTGVANVMLVTGGYHAAKDNDYCLVLDTYRNYTDYNIYTVILEDGTITQLKSEDDLKDLDGVKNMVYTYSTDSKGWTEFESIFKADDSNNDNDNAYYAVNKSVFSGVKDNKYLVSDDSAKLVGDVGDNNITFGYVYVPYAKWVQTYHENFKGQTEWDNMLADRNADVIFNAFDVDTDADTADTIAFEDGQQAVIVYDDKDRVKAAWVIADVEDDIEIPEDDADLKDLYVNEDPEGTINVHTTETLSARQVANVVKNFLNDEDIESVVYTPSDNIATVHYVDNTEVTYEVFVNRHADKEDIAMQEIFDNTVAYEYKDKREYIGTIAVDGSDVTATYESFGDGKDVMNDMARFLGALYRGGKVSEIVYDGTTYTWNAESDRLGSNWESDGTTLVSAIVADVTSDLASGKVSVSLTLDGIDVTFTAKSK